MREGGEENRRICGGRALLSVSVRRHYAAVSYALSPHPPTSRPHLVRPRRSAPLRAACRRELPWPTSSLSTSPTCRSPSCLPKGRSP
eukprot:7043908-Pyramimonas_sp.AAC.1